MKYVKSDVYTVNCGMAYGQAAMLLSLGAKGYRAVQPNSSSMVLTFCAQLSILKNYALMLIEKPLDWLFASFCCVVLNEQCYNLE